ncbi:MAG: hypothetical protein ACI3T9_02210 [Romboutsia timonensis]
MEEEIKEKDSHWKEVMDLVVKYGFLTGAYGGTATLATHKVQLEHFGKEKYLQRQEEMFKNK